MKKDFGPKATGQQKKLIKMMYKYGHTTSNIRKAITDQYIKKEWKGKDLKLARVKQIVAQIKRENSYVRIWQYNRKLQRMAWTKKQINDLRASKLNHIRKKHIKQKTRLAGFLYRYTPYNTKAGLMRRRGLKKLFPRGREGS